MRPPESQFSTPSYTPEVGWWDNVLSKRRYLRTKWGVVGLSQNCPGDNPEITNPEPRSHILPPKLFYLASHINILKSVKQLSASNTVETLHTNGNFAFSWNLEISGHTGPTFLHSGKCLGLGCCCPFRGHVPSSATSPTVPSCISYPRPSVNFHLSSHLHCFGFVFFCNRIRRKGNYFLYSCHDSK